ncbi:hypothetical protein OW763_05190 [Clostridium aestuarii]|uniref:Uncharacterized protein n=1 Tax=Clostridium aestuarii TaxID=338193 RepID=A0ABT4D114_9CLOT|nr:hypothetical protein [Clostridium aestuarii]MCY6483743.1 hypothetical protein [Clostridium aestuarii]
MLKRDVILKISKNNIVSMKLRTERNILKNKRRAGKLIFENLKDLEVCIKNRNVYVLVEGEEVYIKYMVVPKVDKYKLDVIVENQLVYLYGNKADKIFYTYTIWNDKGNELEVLVFCINCDNLKVLEKCINNKIKSINLIQFNFLNYFNKCILEKNYVLIFNFNKDTYLLGICRKKIVANKIIKFNNKKCTLIIEGFNYIIDKLSIYNCKITKIYSANFNEEQFKKYIESQNKFKYVELGGIKDDGLIKSFIVNRR